MDTSPIIRKGRLYRFSQTTAPSAPQLNQIIDNEFAVDDQEEIKSQTSDEISDENKTLLQTNRIFLTPSAPELSKSDSLELIENTNDLMFAPHKVQIVRSDSMDILKDFKNVFLVRSIVKGVLKVLSALVIIAIVIAIAV